MAIHQFANHPVIRIEGIAFDPSVVGQREERDRTSPPAMLAVAVAPDPTPFTLTIVTLGTLGEDRYPEPGVATVMEPTVNPLKVAVAVACFVIWA